MYQVWQQTQQPGVHIGVRCSKMRPLQILLIMKSIIKNKTSLNFLNKSIDSLSREGAPRTANPELLLLYRDVLKMTQRFTWTNEDGQPWREILQWTARSEFELMRKETDAVKVGKFVITWREAVRRIHEKVSHTQMKMMRHIEETRTDQINRDRNEYKD